MRRYPVWAHSVRPGSAKSYGAWANTPTRSEPPAAVARWTPTAVGVFAPTVQPVQMNLQTVCRGRTSGHLLLRLCRSESESTTGRVGRRVAVRLWDCTSQSRQARAQSEGKNRLFDSEINLYRLFGTIYCRLRRYPVGAHSVRPDSAKSYGSWANTPTR